MRPCLGPPNGQEHILELQHARGGRLGRMHRQADRKRRRPATPAEARAQAHADLVVRAEEEVGTRQTDVMLHVRALERVVLEGWEPWILNRAI